MAFKFAITNSSRIVVAYSASFTIVMRIGLIWNSEFWQHFQC